VSRAAEVMGFRTERGTFEAFEDFVQQRRVLPYMPDLHTYLYERELEEFIRSRQALVSLPAEESDHDPSQPSPQAGRVSDRSQPSPQAGRVSDPSQPSPQAGRVSGSTPPRRRRRRSPAPGR